MQNINLSHLSASLIIKRLTNAHQNVNNHNHMYGIIGLC